VEDTRAQRAGQNEDLFRQINERVEELSPGLATLTLVCECADVACIERLHSVSRSEYESVRRHGDRFFVAKGHELDEYETVVEERPGYFVVEKHGDAGRVARELD
jgi:hypothetical protein